MTIWPAPPPLGKSQLEAVLLNRIARLHLPLPVQEYRFCERRWRFDLAWPRDRVAVEIEGGGWVGGRHVRGKGFAQDLEKYATALTLGWRVLRVDGAMIDDNRAAEYLTRLLRPGEREE